MEDPDEKPSLPATSSLQVVVSAVPCFLAAAPDQTEGEPRAAVADTVDAERQLRGKIWDQRCKLAEKEQQLRQAQAGRYDIRCRLAEVSQQVASSCRAQQAAAAAANGLWQTLSEQQAEHHLAIGRAAAEAAGLRDSLAQLTYERALEQQQQLSVVTVAVGFQQQAKQHAAEAAEAHILCAQQQQALDYMLQQQASQRKQSSSRAARS